MTYEETQPHSKIEVPPEGLSCAYSVETCTIMIENVYGFLAFPRV